MIHKFMYFLHRIDLCMSLEILLHSAINCLTVEHVEVEI